MKKLPFGEADFARLRTEDLIYVDKTRQIYEMINYSNYLFLSRPRRFGKSLIISTLENLYLGKKELFKGLWIENNWDWEAHPVVRFDFSKMEYSKGEDAFEEHIITIIKAQAACYQITVQGVSVKSYISSLLQGLFKKTGRRVVILIDEYDKPVTSHLSDIHKAQKNREFLRRIYETIKAESGNIQLVFITGISKFAKMSIFSVVSHLKDISLLAKFNDIVGFTHQEIRKNFAEYLTAFAEKLEISEEEAMQQLAYWYDGYSWGGEEKIYNPFAVINAFLDLQMETYWFETGTPDFLMNLVKHQYAGESTVTPFLEQMENMIASKSTFDSYDLKNINIKAVLFQTGYLTIRKKLQANFRTSYILGFPNFEVRHAFNAHLIKAFTERDVAADIEAKGLYMLAALREKNKDRFLTLVRSIFAGIPSRNLKQLNEYAYQAMFYQMLLLLGIQDIFLEVSGFIGRADGVLVLEKQVFVFEMKFARQGTMDYLLRKAGEQVKAKKYYLPYLGTDREIYRVSLGFLCKEGKEGNIKLDINAEWKLIEEESQKEK